MAEEEEEVQKMSLKEREREAQTEETRGAREDLREKKQQPVEEKVVMEEVEVGRVSPLCPSQAPHPAPRLPSLWPSRVCPRSSAPSAWPPLW